MHIHCLLLLTPTLSLIFSHLPSSLGLAKLVILLASNFVLLVACKQPIDSCQACVTRTWHSNWLIVAQAGILGMMKVLVCSLSCADAMRSIKVVFTKAASSILEENANISKTPSPSQFQQEEASYQRAV